MTEQTALTPFGTSDDIAALDKRLKVMLPGAEKLSQGQRLALAQAAVAHGLDPFNGEIWMIEGRGLMVGIKGLRKKAHQQVKGNYWTEFRLIESESERASLHIPAGSIAYEARLFDSENINTYVEAVIKLMSAKIPWEAVEKLVGTKPFTPGYGILKPGEKTRMEPIACAMKRAEADAIKRRFDVNFGFAVSDDDDGPIVDGQFTEPPEKQTDTYEPTPESIAQTEAELKAKRARDKAALFPED